MPKLLFDESPMVFQRTLAAWIGLNEAIALQELNYKLRDVDGERIGKIEAGIKWYRNSIKEWHKIFSFWDEKAIARTFDTLEKDGLIVSTVFTGRCKWYTIAYTVVDALAGPLPRMLEIKEKRKKAGKESAKKAIMTKCPNATDTDKVSECIGTKCPTSKTPSKPSTLSMGAGELENIELTIDPVAHMLLAAQRGVSESTAPNPADQWFVYRNEMEKLYTKFLRRPLTSDDKDDIVDYCEKYPQDTPSDFDKVLTECRHNWTGGGHCPWSRIEAVRGAGGTWEQWKARTYPQGGNSNGNGSHTTVTLTPAQRAAYEARQKEMQ